MQIPAIFKILCLFTAIVTLYRLKIPLWGALLSVSFLSGLWFKTSAVQTLRYAADSASSAETLFLCAVIVLIMGFSNMMAGTGVLKRIVSAFSALLGKSMYSGAALPALIGLLPMPGGAIFSAPMVESACGSEDGPSPEQKSAINYWFRHIWEYWWPLYPGVILASHLFDVSMWKMVALHLPLTIAAVAGGFFFILRPAFAREKKIADKKSSSRAGLLRQAVSESAGIIVVIATIFGLGPVLGSIESISDISSKYWPVILGFVLGTVWLAVSTKTSALQTIRYILTRSQWSMLLLVVGVMLFRDMLISVEAFKGAQADLETYRVPPLVVIAALPFLSGIVMGLAIGFVGAAFPLVISLLPDQVMNSELRLAYLALAYSFGYIGMMLSPVHFCLIMTKDYFKAELGGIYRCILMPSLVILAAGAGLFLFYLAVFQP